MNTVSQTGTTLWILSPVYRDVESYKILIEKCTQILQDNGYKFEHVAFVAVDDTAGADAEMTTFKTLNMAEVITAPFNLGHQRAIVYGLRHLLERVQETDLVLTLDSDGEDMPESLPLLLKSHTAKNHGEGRITLAWRTKRRESMTFKLMYFFYRFFFYSLTGTVLRTGNFALYNGRILKDCIHHPFFDLCYSSTLLNLGYDLNKVPCARGSRYAGQSRMNFIKLVTHGIRMLLPFMDKIATRAMVAFAVSASIGAAAILYTLAASFYNGTPLSSVVVFGIITTALIGFVSLVQLLILFATFSQSQAISMSRLDHSKRKFGADNRKIS